MNRTPNPRPMDFAKSLVRKGSGYLPLPLLDLMLFRAMALMLGRHPAVFRKMSPFAGRRIGIRPAELAFTFLLTLHPERPSLIAEAEGGNARCDAVIKGGLRALIGMLEGRIDGDALFFSRDLVIEGDTEVVLALRNAVDGAGIDLVADLCSVFGPAAGPAEAVLRRAATLGAGFGNVLGRSA